MAPNNDLEIALTKLRKLLQIRASVVSDSDLLARSPDEHLQQLRTVSEELFELHRSTVSLIPTRLNHFLSNGSYAKALGHINSLLE